MTIDTLQTISIGALTVAIVFILLTIQRMNRR